MPDIEPDAVDPPADAQPPADDTPATDAPAADDTPAPDDTLATDAPAVAPAEVDETMAVIPAAPAREVPSVVGEAAAGERTPVRRRLAGVVLAAVGVLAALYGLDLALTAGDIPRDVVVAGVDIGGMGRAAAEARLHTGLEPRLSSPAHVAAADAETMLDPATADVRIDWGATLDEAARRSYNPWQRVKSFFVDRPVDVVATGDEQAIRAELAALAERVDEKRVEGTIRFDGAEPRAVLPVPGRRLDVPRATSTVITRWAEGGTIVLPVDRLDVLATPEGVREALEGFARQAVSAPVELRANGTTVPMPPEAIGSVLTFAAQPDGSLRPGVDPGRLRDQVGDGVAKLETKAKDARIKFGKKSASVVPSVDGRTVDWDATAADMVDVLRRDDARVVDAVIMNTPAKLTTQELKKLGIKEVTGKFTTRNFAPDSGINIRTVATKVNGAIVAPGETFSLNGYTGPRGRKQGYIEAGVIEQGVPSRAVGGGISQFATTLYNAAYFAAMEDVEHSEHSYHISRYPLAREATVFQNPDGSSVIDLKFRNTADTGVAIETEWTPSSITVKIWGTRHYKVSSVTSDRYNFTSPRVITKPYGTPCVPQGGAGGFSADDTRIISDLDGNVVDRQKRTVVYNPQPVIRCAPPPPPPKPTKSSEKSSEKPSDKPGERTTTKPT